VGLLSKINQYIGELTQKMEPASEGFSIHELMGLKERPTGKSNGELTQLEAKVNGYLKELDEG